MSSPIKLRSSVSDIDHSLGSVDAPMVLLEYGDYECSFCGQAYWIVKELQQTLGDQLRVIFRNFPLTEIHPYALNAAMAAEAAGLQDRFWKMHDVLFENQERLTPTNIQSYAGLLGLKIDKFNQDLESKKVQERVSSDFYGGARTGVNGTPTFFVNGYRFDGDWTTDELLTTLNGVQSRKVQRRARSSSNPKEADEKALR